MSRPLWPQHFGFRFDPFEHLEASQDPHLTRYFVSGDEAISSALDDVPTLVFAPGGGGKTALRTYTYRICWGGGRGYRPFPIPYYLPDLFVEGDAARSLATAEDHLNRLLQTTAKTLFLGLACFPHLFLALPTQLRREVVAFVHTWMPQAGRFYAALRASGNAELLATMGGNSYYLSPSMAPETLPLFIKVWGKLSGEADLLPSTSIKQLWKWLIRVLTEAFPFRAVYILLDGVDAFPEFYASSSLAARSLVAFLLEALGWQEQKVFVKAFLPQEMQFSLQGELREKYLAFRTFNLSWDAERLAQMIKARVRVATEGRFDSLSAVTALPLGYEEIEYILAEQVCPLPREMLSLVNRVLYEYDLRVSSSANAPHQIQSEDVEKAIHWYKSTSPVKPVEGLAETQ